VSSDPARLVQEWLETNCSQGFLHSRGRFTIDQEAAQALGNLAKLRLSDVPLLLLAGAVEGGSRYFRIHGRQNLRFSWEGMAGPCGEVALSLLRAARIDLCWEQHGCELPSGFRDYLEPLAQRSRHAPLSLIWGDRVLTQRASGGSRMVVRSARGGQLTLVDRGLDFTFPAAFPGLDIVAWVEPLPGAPWPRQLLWSPRLESQIVRIAQALKTAVGC
jgi:hypothetical protein